jgi:hypothetical protein
MYRNTMANVIADSTADDKRAVRLKDGELVVGCFFPLATADAARAIELLPSASSLRIGPARILRDDWRSIVDAAIATSRLQSISIVDSLVDVDDATRLLAGCRHVKSFKFLGPKIAAADMRLFALLRAAEDHPSLRELRLEDRTSSYPDLVSSVAHLISRVKHLTTLVVHANVSRDAIHTLENTLDTVIKKSWPLRFLSLQFTYGGDAVIYHHWDGTVYREQSDHNSIYKSLRRNYSTSWPKIHQPILDLAITLRPLICSGQLCSYAVLWIVDWLPLLSEPAYLDPHHLRKLRLIESVLAFRH